MYDEDDGSNFLKSIGVKLKQAELDEKHSAEYEEWLNPKPINESVLDPVHNTLAKDVWTRDQKLKSKHRDYILDTLREWLDKMGVEKEPSQVAIIGSITTFQYSKTSDIDVNVVIDVPESKKDELIKFLPNETPLPDTQHPVNYYIASDAGKNVEKKPTAYDVLNDKWFSGKSPKKSQVEYPYGYVIEIARFFMDGIDARVAEFERDKIEYELYKEYRDDDEVEMSKEELQKAIEQKRLEILADLDAIFVAHKMVKAFRGKAFEEDYEPDFLIDIKTVNRDFSVNNLVYKALERFGYLEKLDKYKDERKKWEY